MVPHAWCQDVRVAFSWVKLLAYYETMFWDDDVLFEMFMTMMLSLYFNMWCMWWVYDVNHKCLIYILIFLLWISPLLLELPPCGQVQVTKLRCADVRSLVWRRIALIRNGMGSLLESIPLCILWKLFLWLFSLTMNIMRRLWGLAPRPFWRIFWLWFRCYIWLFMRRIN